MAALTYDQLIAQIAARLNRDDLDPDPRGVFVIRDAVVDRIDFYKKECLYTGQVVDTSITMVAGTTHYNNPEGWEELINIQLKQGSVWLDLERKSYEFIDGLDVNDPPTRSIPIYWAGFNNQFRVWPAPAGAYPVQVVMNVPPGPPANSASNFWTADAKSLVINGAAAEILDTYLNNPAKAMQFRGPEERELLALQAKTIRARGGIQIQGYI